MDNPLPRGGPSSGRGPPPPGPKTSKPAEKKPIQPRPVPKKVLTDPHAIPEEDRYLSHHDGLTLQIASDLHLEFYKDGIYPADLIKPVAPVLGLLGDIGLPGTPGYTKFLLEQASNFELVLVVLGNHEYYQEHNRSHGSKILTFEEVKSQVQEICASSPKLLFLDGRAVQIGGVRVIGATLWTSIPTHAAPYAGGINDYNYIMKSENGSLVPITYQDSREWHDKELGFIMWQVEESMANKEKDCVVLTHHAPSMTGTSEPQYEGPFSNRMNFAFSSSLEYSFKNFGKQGNSNISYWCYGHTHFSNQVDMFGTMVCSNQLGYPGAKNSYKPDFVISVKKS